MIHPIAYYIPIYLLMGGLGMYLANRRVEKPTQQQRWLKYVTYILIVSTVLGAIFLEKFSVLAGLIGAIGFLEILRASSSSLKHWLALLMISIYSLIAGGFLGFSLHFDREFLLFIYFQVFTFDGFSQVTGQLFGKHPLMPQISPGKTVEGLIGGLLFCVLSAVLARDWIQCSLWQGIGFGILTAGLAFAGDTLASSLKRVCKLKDYSNLLPGHGGILDRFDSLLMAGMGYLWLMQVPVLWLTL